MTKNNNRINPTHTHTHTYTHTHTHTKKKNSIRTPHARIQDFSSGGGGPGQPHKKSSDVFLFCFFVFLVLSLFYRSQMVNIKETYHFSRFQRGSNIFQGDPTFSRGGGSNCLFPIETHITCDFPGGGIRTPCPPPPLDPHLPLKELSGSAHAFLLLCW